jgi:hypothetical protein
MALRINDKVYKKKIKKLEKFVANRLPKLTLDEYKQNTPIDGGNARRNTKITKKRRTGFTILANYAYSGVIDQGKYPNPPKAGTGKTKGGYSTQALKGMGDPTLKFIERTVKKYIRSI